MVIGITGHPAAGKDAAAAYLETKGFRHISSGDVIREAMRKENIPTDREHIHVFARTMRAKHGNSYPFEEVAKRVSGDTVVSGFRNLAEYNLLREKFGDQFILLAIDAPIEIRYARIHKRQRTGDAISFEQFKAEEERERSHDSGSHEVDKVVAAADVTIENAGSEQELHEKLDNFFAARRVGRGER